MIHELKPVKSKSSKYVEQVLLEALAEARRNKVTSVCIAMTMKGEVYNDHAITPGSSWSEVIGGLERQKTRIVNQWLDDE